MADNRDVAKSAVTHGHSVQLFDSHESAADALTRFVAQGFTKGDQMLVVTRLEDWNRAAVKLTQADAPLSDASAQASLLCTTRLER
jgi:hypothetical protein